MVTHSERHPTDLAGLRGARLVISQETERGRRWAEAMIKALTGGDPITARFMRQDFFGRLALVLIWLSTGSVIAVTPASRAHALG